MPIRTNSLPLLLSALLALSTPARADTCTYGRGENCSVNNNGYGVVLHYRAVGQTADGAFQAGLVTHTYPDGDAEILLDGSRKGAKPARFPMGSLAITSPGHCEPALSAFCVGFLTPRGEIAGVFPNSGDLLVRENGKLTRVSQAGVTATKPVHLEGLAARVGRALEAIVEKRPREEACASSVVAASESSPELKEALARLRSGTPTPLSDFLKTFAADSPGSSQPDPWKACENPALLHRPLRTNANGEIAAECAPEVYYSWISPAQFKLFELHMGKIAWSSNPSLWKHYPTFLSRTPAASFGFGGYDEKGGMLARLKIRPGTKIKYLGTNVQMPDCAKQSREEADHTVYLRLNTGDEGGRYWNRYSGEDFMLCSTAPVESWSYGTKQGYDEIARDVKFALEPATAPEWPGYLQALLPGDPKWKGQLFNYNSDNRPMTQTQLIHSLGRQLELAESGNGKIYYNPALGAERPDPFQLTNPTWFAPGKAGEKP